jgi:uncharacterized membrane protein
MASEHPTIPPHVKETVESIVDLHQRGREDVTRHQRWIEQLTSQLGRPRSLYTIIFFVAAWIALNLWLMSAGHVAFDPPPFQGLQGVITLSALLVATMVLTTQNRQYQGDTRRSRLALHMNLLAEAEVTKLISLLEELRRDMPNVRNRRDEQAEEMQKPIDPKLVSVELEKKLERDSDPL